jgi:hypothetical protein
MSRDTKKLEYKSSYGVFHDFLAKRWIAINDVRPTVFVLGDSRNDISERRQKGYQQIESTKKVNSRDKGISLCLERWNVDECNKLDYLWGKNESGWQIGILNPNSYACGIPQAVPCTKIYQWATKEWIDKNKFQIGTQWFISGDCKTEIIWGLDYIQNRKGYGNISNALQHQQIFNWY